MSSQCFSHHICNRLDVPSSVVSMVSTMKSTLVCFMVIETSSTSGTFHYRIHNAYCCSLINSYTTYFTFRPISICFIWFWEHQDEISMLDSIFLGSPHRGTSNTFCYKIFESNRSCWNMDPNIFFTIRFDYNKLVITIRFSTQSVGRTFDDKLDTFERYEDSAKLMTALRAKSSSENR